MKKLLQEKMFNLIAKRAQTANDAERKELTAKIEAIRDMLDSM
jgi:hypothetical protein